jgi:hypothetical protein
MKILESWEEPIDIIIPIFEFYVHLNSPFNEEAPMEDEYFRQMQEFYNRLNSIARETVFVPNIHMDWGCLILIRLVNLNSSNGAVCSAIAKSPVLQPGFESFWNHIGGSVLKAIF